MRAKKEQSKRVDDVLRFIETCSMYSHPKISLSKLSQSIQQRELRKKAPEMQRELEADYELAKQHLPQVLNIIVDDEKEKPILPLAKNIKRRKKRAKKRDL